MALSTLLLPLLVFFAFSIVRAQEAWTVVASPTTQDLWGVAARPADNTSRLPIPALFVAAGEGGTLLTSPDGSAWTPRVSGTARRLGGVAYVGRRFIAVGEGGTLLTSDDGLTWTVRASGTTERLNAVAFGYGRWLAVGENGVVVTSLDSATWTPVRPDTQNGWTLALTGPHRGLCFGYGQFVAVGPAGHIISTVEADFFYNRSVETITDLAGVAYAKHRFVAVGDGGLVLTSPDAVTWRGAVVSPAVGLRAVEFFNNTFVAATREGSVLLSPDGLAWRAVATGNTANLNALAGADGTLVAVGAAGTLLRSAAASTAPAIATPPASLAEAAGNNVLLSVIATGTTPLSYQWSAGGRPLAGATTDTLALPAVTASNSGGYTVTVANALGSVTSPAATLTVIPAFAAPGDYVDHTFVPAVPFGASPHALAVQADGKVVVANAATLARLNPDGSADVSFTPLILPAAVQINSLVLQADGKILAAGANGQTNPQPYLVRVLADGRPDPSFSPATALPTQAIAQLILQPDGKILVAAGVPYLLRLNADGSLDSTFARSDVTSYWNDPTTTAAARLAALTPDGRILVTFSTTQILSPPYQNGSRVILLVRLRADGTVDPSFTPTRTGLVEPRLLSCLADGKIILASEETIGSIFGIGSWKLQRLNPDGTPDPTFLTQTGSIVKYSGNTRAAVDSAGRIVLLVAFNNFDPGLKVARFQPNGSIDPTLRFEEPLQRSFGQLLNAIAVSPNGQTLVSRADKFFRVIAANTPVVNPPVAFTEPALAPLVVAGGSTVAFTVPTAGTNPKTVGWQGFYADHTSGAPNISPGATLPVSNLRVGATFYATIANPAGTVTYPPQVVHVAPAPPSLLQPLTDLSVEEGRGTTVSFNAAGSGPLTYQWFFNGQVIKSGTSLPSTGDTSPENTANAAGALTVFDVDASTAGQYKLVLTNPLGTTTATVNLSLNHASRLVNVATRGYVGTGDNTLIAGFVVAGTGPKWVLIRGIGPGLAQFGFTDYLADPKLTLFDSTGAKLDENDNWIGSQESYTILNWPAMFPVATGSRDAIIQRRLPPGNYTVEVSGVGGTTGTALVEVYDGIHDLPRLSNLSSRVLVRTGAQIAISGLVITGGSPKTLLIRAVGPGLAPFGLSGLLANPTLTLVNAGGATVATNDDWETNPDLAALRAASASVGAFGLPAGSRDSAVLVTLPPGAYTALVSGVDGTSGLALVEVYEIL